MANKYKGEVSFEAGGESYILRFSANAIVALEEKFDKTLKQLGEMMSDAETLRMSTVKEIFCIGLVDHYSEARPDIDRAKAEIIFGRLRPIDATALMNDAFVAAFETPEAGNAAASANPPQPGNPTVGTGPDS